METEKDGAEKNLPVLLKKCPENFDSEILFKYFWKQQQNFREWVKYMLSFEKKNESRKFSETIDTLPDKKVLDLFNILISGEPKEEIYKKFKLICKI